MAIFFGREHNVVLSMVNDGAMYILSTRFFALKGLSVLQDITLPEEEKKICIIKVISQS